MTVMGAALLTRALPRIGDTPIAAQREISAPKLKADDSPGSATLLSPPDSFSENEKFSILDSRF